MARRKEAMSNLNTQNPLHDPEIRRTYEEELMVGEATETLGALIQELGISQRELANRLDLSESRVSQVLNGGANLTLKSLAAFGWALGLRFDLDPVPMSMDERVGTPARDDPPAPEWLGRKPMAEVRWLARPASGRMTHSRRLAAVRSRSRVRTIRDSVALAS